jgi:hypothetical protein
MINPLPSALADASLLAAIPRVLRPPIGPARARALLMLDAQLLQGAADLREAGVIHALAGAARIKRPRGPIGG